MIIFPIFVRKDIVTYNAMNTSTFAATIFISHETIGFPVFSKSFLSIGYKPKRNAYNTTQLLSGTRNSDSATTAKNIIKVYLYPHLARTTDVTAPQTARMLIVIVVKTDDKNKSKREDAAKIAQRTIFSVSFLITQQQLQRQSAHIRPAQQSHGESPAPAPLPKPFP